MPKRNLPPLTALRAFEAFARHGRMNLAADELCVTHGAISRQVRSLERLCGVRLRICAQAPQTTGLHLLGRPK